jgi:hypothetical protein
LDKPLIANCLADIDKVSGQKIWITSPSAARLLGAGYFSALSTLKPDLIWIYDCGERPGDVLAALREGIKHIAIASSCKTPALESLAAAQGAKIFTEKDWC